VSRPFRDWPSSPGGLAELYPRNPDPTLRVNFISSLDGAVTVEGLSGGLHGPGDKEIFDTLRMVCDALIVASGTVKAENYGALRLAEPAAAWRRAHGLPEHPIMVIVSGSLDLDLGLRVFTEAPTRPIVVTGSSAPPERIAEIARAAEVIAVGDDAVDLRAAVAVLHERGAAQLLCEGGPHLLGALAAADLVTELCLTVSPLLVGGGPGRIAAGAPGTPRRMSLRHVLTAEDMLFLRYARRDG